MTHLLASLTADEVAQLLDLSRKYKKRFQFIAEELLACADDEGVAEDIARLSVSAECLMVAAFYYTGDRASFIESAGLALDSAMIKRRPETA
jgi:hypothetical protein